MEKDLFFAILWGVVFPAFALWVGYKSMSDWFAQRQADREEEAQERLATRQPEPVTA